MVCTHEKSTKSNNHYFSLKVARLDISVNFRLRLLCLFISNVSSKGASCLCLVVLAEYLILLFISASGLDLGLSLIGGSRPLLLL